MTNRSVSAEWGDLLGAIIVMTLLVVVAMPIAFAIFIVWMVCALCALLVPLFFRIAVIGTAMLIAGHLLGLWQLGF